MGWPGSHRFGASHRLGQGARIPAEATSVDLAFWWLPESASEQPGDAVDVLIQYGAEQGDVLLILRAEEPLGQWRPEMIDLSAASARRRPRTPRR